MKMHLAALVSALALIAPVSAVAKDHQQPYAVADNDSDDHKHNCVNPAGNERGWCKQHHQGIYNCNGYNGNNGYPNPNNTCSGNGYNNGQNGNVVLRGVITRVNGNTVTMLQGLSTITFDDSLAYRNGRVNGSLYPTRSVTVTGYYDNNGYFRATSIG
jgi:hypothetical protein